MEFAVTVVNDNEVVARSLVFVKGKCHGTKLKKGLN
jgi:hypothetical protein